MSRAKIFKVVLLGDGAVGKSSIQRRYLGQGFEDGYMMSIGADFAVKRTSIDGINYVCQIWDLAGQRRFSAVREIYYKGSNGCLMVYDVTSPRSFYNVPNWLSELMKNNQNRMVPAILVANKVDLRGSHEEEITSDQGKEYAQKLSEWLGIEVPYVETSAKTGSNIEVAFANLMRSIVAFYGL